MVLSVVECKGMLICLFSFSLFLAQDMRMCLDVCSLYITDTVEASVHLCVLYVYLVVEYMCLLFVCVQAQGPFP